MSDGGPVAPEKKPSRRRENRIAAMQFLYAWDMNPSDVRADAVYNFFENRAYPRNYYVFAEDLVNGTLNQIEAVDGKIRELARNWDFHRIARVDLAILRLAIYELLFRTDIPPVVSINEAIELGKAYSSDESKRFINGILDKMKDGLTRPLRSPVGDDPGF